MTFILRAAQVFREFVTNGVPSSGKHEPNKSEIRDWGRELEDVISALSIAGAFQGRWNASSGSFPVGAQKGDAWVVGTPGIVSGRFFAEGDRIIALVNSASITTYLDNWVVVPAGTSGIATAVDLGEGTANAIRVRTEAGNGIKTGALVAFELFRNATAAPVTISIDGKSAIVVKTPVGEVTAALSAGQLVVGQVRSAEFYLITDPNVSQLAAHAQNQADRAEAARDVAVSVSSEAVSASEVPIRNSINSAELLPVKDGITKLIVLGSNGGFFNDGGTGDPVFETPSATGATAREWQREFVDLPTQYSPTSPFVSTMADLKARGMRPEWVDSGNEIGNDADAAIPIREMFNQGIDDGFTKFVFSQGVVYNLNSADPLDDSEAIAVLLNGISSDIHIEATGSVIKGLNGIHENEDNPGAMFRIMGDGGVSPRQQFSWTGGRLDMTELTPAAANVMTVGGLALGGRLNIQITGVLFDHGITTPSGEDIGVGGGDQSVFCTNYESLLISGNQFIGAPDLGVYLSNSGGKEARIVQNLFYRCSNGIAQKRQSSRSIIALNTFLECEVGIYNPVSDGSMVNHGGGFYIHSNRFERIQRSPVDIGGSSAAGSIVNNNVFKAWCRRISDGGEISSNSFGHAVRVRVPNCRVDNNVFDLGEWRPAGDNWSTVTEAKRQRAIDFGYTGGDVGVGATDCGADGNTYVGVYRSHVFGSNTARNRVTNRREIDVAVMDADSGANFRPYVMTNGTLITITPPRLRSVLAIECDVNSSGNPNGTFWCNTTNSPETAMFPRGVSTPSGITLTENVTTVSGATNGQFTISTSAGKIYLINRSGGTVTLNYWFITG